MPGRPIKGERLVRPDGTITLGFYGDVYVRGLTLLEAKEKIVLYLCQYLNDEVLGLRSPKDKLDPLPAEGEPFPPDEEAVSLPSPKNVNPIRPIATKASSNSPKKRRTALVAAYQEQETHSVQVKPGSGLKITIEVQHGEPSAPKVEQPAPEVDLEMELVAVTAMKSERAFVDIAAYNSVVYQVLGEVNTPGRLSWTGRETILDAITFAGGISPTADAETITLFRPMRGEVQAKAYPIDYFAILRGETKSNLQLFPGDRLFINPRPVAKAKVQAN